MGTEQMNEEMRQRLLLAAGQLWNDWSEDKPQSEFPARYPAMEAGYFAGYEMGYAEGLRAARESHHNEIVHTRDYGEPPCESESIG